MAKRTQGTLDFFLASQKPKKHHPDGERSNRETILTKTPDSTSELSISTNKALENNL